MFLFFKLQPYCLCVCFWGPRSFQSWQLDSSSVRCIGMFGEIFESVTPWKFNSSLLNIVQSLQRKGLSSEPSFFRGELLNFAGVPTKKYWWSNYSASLALKAPEKKNSFLFWGMATVHHQIPGMKGERAKEQNPMCLIKTLFPGRGWQRGRFPWHDPSPEFGLFRQLHFAALYALKDFKIVWYFWILDLIYQPNRHTPRKTIICP